MKHYTEFHGYYSDTLETIRTNKQVEYLNIEAGLDIETTSTIIGENKLANMYVWMFGIGFEDDIYYGRNWNELLQVYSKLQQQYGLNKDRRLVVYVHNLGYEFQFMRHYFNWLEVFSISERKPIKALTDYGIEFRDSYILSGYSLANTAKNLTTYKVDKMVGDLDYSLIRHSETPLTDLEMGYCENDVRVILAYIKEQIEQCGNISKIPNTNTGRVRSYVRNKCYYTHKSHKKTSRGKYQRYRNIMKDLTIEPDVYIQLKRAFMGGFTHANSNFSGVKLNNVSSVDFTSSYPSVMLSEKYPMSRFKPANIENEQQFETMCSKFAVIMNVRFVNIRAKITQENYISESKCFELNKPVINNGRIFSADSLAITLTEIDYDIIKQCYEWDDIQINDIKYAHKAYLPKSIIESILDLYQKKTELKDVEGFEVEYMLSKGMLNSIYGMCVTDIVKDNAVYDGEWGTEIVDIDEQIDKYNKSSNRFLYYPWGVWVTAYARRNLWTGILAIGDDYVYCDTDSLKMLNYEKHTKYFEWFDNQIVEKMKRMCSEYKLDTKLLSPKTKQGKTKMIGVWDFEGNYSTFKTLGAKRYLVEHNDKLYLTVAGLSKKDGLKYIQSQCENNQQVFDMFNDSLYIPASETGKMTHTYIDDEMKYQLTDYLGNKKDITSKSGIHLGDCDFTLSISKQYLEFMKNFSKGYIYSGVKYV